MNTQPEALRLANALDDYSEGPGNYRMTAEAAAELRRLHRVELAYNEWITKTEWVQETAQPKELGKHRADILTKRIEVLHEVNQMLVEALDDIVYWYGARDKNDNLLSKNNQNEEIKQAMEALAKAKEQA